jgi:hypothetical protein
VKQPKTQLFKTFQKTSSSQLKRIGAWEKYAHALLQTNEALFIN